MFENPGGRAPYPWCRRPWVRDSSSTLNRHTSRSATISIISLGWSPKRFHPRFSMFFVIPSVFAVVPYAFSLLLLGNLSWGILLTWPNHLSWNFLIRKYVQKFSNFRATRTSYYTYQPFFWKTHVLRKTEDSVSVSIYYNTRHINTIMTHNGTLHTVFMQPGNWKGPISLLVIQFPECQVLSLWQCYNFELCAYFLFSIFSWLKILHNR